jgi:uncharacterized repeat protein (TIGR03803 family)
MPHAAGLINVNGTLYGTTECGGANGNIACPESGTGGTIYSFDPATSTETVVHNFGSGKDGDFPQASLVDVNGTLYGTTHAGGKYGTIANSGTVYSFDPTTGTEKVIHNFGKGKDGAWPEAGLIAVNGTLYGTTVFGGKYGGSFCCGTVFSMSLDGTNYRVLYSFGKGTSARNLVGGLLAVQNGSTYTLYGSAAYGGPYGGGSAFSISTAGTNYRVLHNFGQAPDGFSPAATLIDVNGTLYGTTFAGGKYSAPSSTGGTLFRMSLTGTEKVLHNFGGGLDGQYPYGPLIVMNRTLYGTTACGGLYGNGLCLDGDGSGQTGGTVFRISTSGTHYKVLHNFGRSKDGNKPFGGLLDANGTLYGVTHVGGRFRRGAIYSLTP